MKNNFKVLFGITSLTTSACIIVVSNFVSSAVIAQNLDQMMYQNQLNMQQNDQMMQGMMQNSQQQAESSLQQYISQNYSQLSAEAQQYNQNSGQNLSVEQYARAKIQEEAARRMNTAQGGVNPIFEAQKRQFEAGQQAYRAQQNSFDTQNQNWRAGQNQIDTNNQAWNDQQRRIESDNNRFIQQGIQGNQYYRNSETGEVAELPFAGSPGVYGDTSGNTWVSPEMGQYNQIGPNGVPQQMESYEPGFYE